MEVYPVLRKKIDNLEVRVFDTDVAMGKAASDFAVSRIEKVIGLKGRVNLILATGSSQFTFLNAFRENPSIDWSKITVFHLDEYVGISSEHPASFRNYMHRRIIDSVTPAQFYELTADAKDIQQEIKRYTTLLNAYPPDLACIGIGENGHIAFNEPHVADFDDKKLVKLVDLDKKSRMQQVKEGWFGNLDEVPAQALTLTIPAIMNSGSISCVVPDQRKADAVNGALYGPVSTQCPASILRTHLKSVLFLDSNSAEGLLRGEKEE